MSASKEPLVWVRGDDEVLVVTVKNADGTPFDLTNYTIRYVLKTLATDADAAALILKDITEILTVDGQILTPATNGIAHVFIEDDDTLTRPVIPPVDLSLRSEDVNYFHGIKGKSATGLYRTLAKGKSWLEREIVDNY